jgi:hypothetical protein
MGVCREHAIKPETLVIYRKNLLGRVVKTLNVGSTNYMELRGLINNCDDPDRESPPGNHGRIYLEEVEEPFTSENSLLQWTWDNWVGVEHPIKAIREAYPRITTSRAAFQHYSRWRREKENFRRCVYAAHHSLSQYLPRDSVKVILTKFVSADPHGNERILSELFP